jgi:hypothetical protein
MAEILYCFKQVCEKMNINCFNTLKNISYDKENRFYLCQCNSNRFDFDLFVEEYYSHPIPSSVDTIFFDEINKKLYLIEFKNQKCSEIDSQKIKNKVENTIDIIKSISKNCGVKFKEYKIIVGIVYNDKPKWRRGICSNTIQFGLEYLKEQNIIKDVKTNDIEWFKKEYFRIKNDII